MSTIDNRVVEMKFDNAQFERGVKTTTDSLNNLNKSLKLEGATKGFSDVANSAKNLQLGHIGDAVQSIAGKFSAMGVIAITTLANITNRAVDAGINLTKSLTLTPITDGFAEYELKMGSIQTILANTARYGTTLKQVTDSLDDLNLYADQTIYNFGDMTKNIGLFTNAGIRIEEATAMIKGFSNEAAASGTNAMGAAGAAYQLSQALSAGVIRLMDWRSLTNVGMGNKNMQNGLIQIADAMGLFNSKTTTAKAAAQDFNGSLEKQWLTADVMSNYLKIQAGELSDAQMKALGLTKEQIVAFKKQAAIAQDAATKTRTFTGLMGTLKEGIGSSWAQTFDILLGDFDEATELFSSAGDRLGGIVNKMGEARNNLLQGWADKGGRTAAIDAIKNAFNALLSVIKPIRDAFRQIFPPTTADQLVKITVAIRDFTAKLKMGSETADKVKRIFAGVFAVFDILWTVVKAIGKVFFNLFGIVAGGSGSFLELVARVGDFVVWVRNAIKDGDGLTKVFDKLGSAIGAPVKWLQMLSDYMLGFFHRSKGDLDGFASVWDKIGNAIKAVWTFIQPFIAKVGNFFRELGGMIKEAFAGLSFGDILAGIATGAFAMLTIQIGGLIKKLKDKLTGGGGGGNNSGMFAPLKEALDGVTDSLNAMQNTLRATTLLTLAVSIGILALSVNALAKIDPVALTAALTAMTVMFAQLGGSLFLFEKYLGEKDIAKMMGLAIAMGLLGIAIRILASSVKTLAELSWDELARGMAGLVGMLGALIATVKLMPDDKKMISSSIGLILMAAAIKILAGAVTDLAGLSWEDMASGLIGVGAILTALAIFSKSTKYKGGIMQDAGLLLLAVGIGLLATALKKMSGMSWEEIARGLVALAGSLGIMTGALALIPPTAALGAAGVLILAVSLKMVGEVLQVMGQMSWGEIGKALTTMLGVMTIMAAALYVIPPTAALGAAGVLIVAMSLEKIGDFLQRVAQFSWEEIGKAMTVLAGSLLIIGAALIPMTFAVPGAMALLIVAGALTVIAPVLEKFGQMSWGEIGAALLMLGGAFAVIGVGSLLLIPAVPILFAFGAAVVLLGAGLLAAGAGVFLFAAGITALSALGTVAAENIYNTVGRLLDLIPLVMQKIGEGVIAFANVIATGGPAITDAITTVLESIIDAIDRIAPKIIRLLEKLFNMMLDVLTRGVPKMVRAGLKIITGVLEGIGDNIHKIVTVATRVITEFLRGIGDNIGKITNAGADLIIKFVNSLASTIESRSEEMGQAGGRLASAIVRGMIKGLSAGTGEIASAARDVAKTALNAAKNLLGIHSPSKEFEKIGKYVIDGFRKGLDGNKQDIANAFNNLKGMLADAMKKSAQEVKNLEAKLKKLTSARKKDKKAIDATKKALAQARKEQAAEKKAYDELTKKLASKNSELQKLADKQATVAAKLDEANKQLDDAIKTRNDFEKQIKDQYDNIPDTAGEDRTLASFVDDLRKQIEETQKFATEIQKLRDLGLSDAMYKELLAKGPAALPFIEDVLAAGKNGVDELNQLTEHLDILSGGLGFDASKELYQAGVDAALGLVEGLKQQHDAIEKEMDKIADAMVKAIKKALGIKSPSREFRKIGEFSIEGLIAGIDKLAETAKKSSMKVGAGTLESLRKSLSKVPDILSDIDANPTIRPVLDLDDIRKNAGEIGKMLRANPISVGASYSHAKDASAGYYANREAIEGGGTLANHTELNFTQNNYSPKAISAADTYRNTKNQLSVTKGALANANNGRS